MSQNNNSTEQKELYNLLNIQVDDINEKLNHSNRRYDILLNAICAGGLILIYSLVKDIGFDNIGNENKKYLLFIGAGFTLTILINFYSIFLENILYKKTYSYVFKVRTETLKPPPIKVEHLKSILKNTEKYEKWAKYLKNTSVVLMTASIISIATFLFCYVGI